MQRSNDAIRSSLYRVKRLVVEAVDPALPTRADERSVEGGREACRAAQNGEGDGSSSGMQAETGDGGRCVGADDRAVEFLQADARDARRSRLQGTAAPKLWELVQDQLRNRGTFGRRRIRPRSSALLGLL
jgi:hypothetical protein